MIILGSMGQQKCGLELAKYFNQGPPSFQVVRQGAVGNIAAEKFSSEKVCAGGHLLAPPRGEIFTFAARLSFIAPAKHANGRSPTVRLGPRESARAKQIGIIRVRNHSQNSFGFERKAHMVLYVPFLSVLIARA